MAAMGTASFSAGGNGASEDIMELLTESDDELWKGHHEFETGGVVGTGAVA